MITNILTPAAWSWQTTLSQIYQSDADLFRKQMLGIWKKKSYND